MEDKLSLKTYRMLSGLTLKQAADKAEISEKSLSSWENDNEKLRSAKFDSVIRLCEIYGTTIDHLYY